MKARISAKWLFILLLVVASARTGVAQDSPPPSPSLADSKTLQTQASPWLAEFAKLLQAGVNDAVLLAYVNTAGIFNLTSDQIICLHEKGVSDGVIIAILQHDSEFSSGLRQPPAPPAPASETLLAGISATGPSESESPITAPTGLAGGPGAVPGASDADDFSIVNRPETTIFEDLMAFESPESSELQPAPMAQTNVSPVREPYPVPLNDPIIVVRAPSRMPNIQILARLP